MPFAFTMQFTLMGDTNSRPLKNAPVATSTPTMLLCSWNSRILSDHAFL